ncbi:unnamed protein product [Leuciscus chuanchicus]
MPCGTLCPLIHHSLETALHSNEASRADTYMYTHPVWTSSNCTLGGPKARLISSRGMKAYGCGFSNSPRAHNKSLEGASVLEPAGEPGPPASPKSHGKTLSSVPLVHPEPSLCHLPVDGSWFLDLKPGL